MTALDLIALCADIVFSVNILKEGDTLKVITVNREMFTRACVASLSRIHTFTFMLKLIRNGQMKMAGTNDRDEDNKSI